MGFRSQFLKADQDAIGEAAESNVDVAGLEKHLLQFAFEGWL